MQAETRRFQLTFGILSLGYILLGLLQLFAPTSSKQVICTVLGIVAMAVGILRIAMFFIKPDPQRVFRNDLAVGAVLLMGGIYLIVKTDAVWNFLPIIIGFAMVFDSIIKLQYAFELRRVNFMQWWAVMVVALITTVLAVLLVLDRFGPEFRQFYWPVVMLVDGVANLSTIILLGVWMKRLAKGEKKPSRRKAAKEADAQAGATTAQDVQNALDGAGLELGWDDEL